MDFDETMVEEEFNDVEADDTLPDDIVEEDESYDEEFPDEEELEIPDEESEEEYEEQEPEPEPEPQPSEPGWIKQRVNKAVERAVRETEARMQAMFEQQMAPLYEKMMEDEARELVASRKVSDIETARELVRLRHNAPAAEAPQEQQRDERGRFVSNEQIVESAKTEARIDELYSQAQKIKAKGGPDVIKYFSENEDIKQRVVSGELDFYEVAELMGKPKKRPPSPVRSSNGANYSPNTFMNMSDEQFERFEKKLDGGVRYTIK